MKRNRKNSIKKERIIMIASSAFVLAALTLTGVYMKEGNVESKDEGYTVDFEAIETEKKPDTKKDVSASKNTGQMEGQAEKHTARVTEDDLDYMPMEAGSVLVEIPGLTDEKGRLPESAEVSSKEGAGQKGEEAALEESAAKAAEAEKEDTSSDPARESEETTDEQTGADKVIVQKELAFGPDKGLIRPVSGEVLLPYSMDSSIYFATLDQYKYNPAVIFAAKQGSGVLACAEGKVVNVFKDSEIGNGLTLELGNGYEATYGQLEGIEVTIGSYVNPGETIAAVASPTKYFSVEGSNLYFVLTKDGAPVNPQEMF